MKRPNFFIVGAPKCGTSTLANTLRWHPRIFVPLAFEPQFFSSDFNSIVDYTPESYLQLFEAASEQHAAVGEKSVIYLYSDKAVPAILEFDPNAKLIAMLRNPIDLVYSWHSQLHYSFIEHVEDFEAAWHLQESRAQGENIGERCRVPFALQYREIGMLGKYVRRLLERAPADQVKIIFMEDFHKDANAVYSDILQFLDVPYAPRRDARKINSNKRHRFRNLGILLAHDTNTRASRALRKLERIPLVKQIPIKYWLHEFNKIEYKRPPLSPVMRSMLREEFHDDVLELSTITGRDLSHWLD